MRWLRVVPALLLLQCCPATAIASYFGGCIVTANVEPKATYSLPGYVRVRFAAVEGFGFRTKAEEEVCRVLIGKTEFVPLEVFAEAPDLLSLNDADFRLVRSDLKGLQNYNGDHSHVRYRLHQN